MFPLDAQFVDRLLRRLSDSLPGGSVFLFGSYARGGARADSDLDILVVEPEVSNRLQEACRIRKMIDQWVGIPSVPIELLVVTTRQFAYWKDTPNTLFYEIAREGKRYESAA